MGMMIEDGKGTGRKVGVNSHNQILTHSVVRQEIEQASIDGDSFNLNTGLMTLTSANESGVFFLKNTNPEKDIFLTSIIVILGPSTGGSSTDTVRFRIYKNTTSGTLVSNAVALAANSNRNFGSSKILTALGYKGDEGYTITDGEVHIESLISPGNRAPIALQEVLKNGNSIAISLEPQDSNTSMKCMIAIPCYQKDPE